MRKQFVKTLEQLLEENPKVVLLLGDIGVHGFRNAMKKYPSRVRNVGILEQSTIGVAAGLSISGMIPVVHTIAPFIAERSLEQLKDDFGYQQLGGNFVSVGASFDYASLGCTHHCPSDVSILKRIPGMEIIVPGTGEEFDTLFKQAYNNNKPTYFRLSEKTNKRSEKVRLGKANVIKKGKLATIIAFGPLLDNVLEAAKDEDVTILYYSSIAPFDKRTLKENCTAGKILLCEPFYSGTNAHDISEALFPQKIIMDFVGVPNVFLRNYGTATDHEEKIGLNTKTIRKKLLNLISI
jgi:transketolase